MKTSLIVALIAGAVLRSDAQTTCGDDVVGAYGLEPVLGGLSHVCHLPLSSPPLPPPELCSADLLAVFNLLYGPPIINEVREVCAAYELVTACEGTLGSGVGVGCDFDASIDEVRGGCLGCDASLVKTAHAKWSACEIVDGRDFDATCGAGKYGIGVCQERLLAEDTCVQLETWFGTKQGQRYDHGCAEDCDDPARAYHLASNFCDASAYVNTESNTEADTDAGVSGVGPSIALALVSFFFAHMGQQ
jgi:hypothetical protein